MTTVTCEITDVKSLVEIIELIGKKDMPFIIAETSDFFLLLYDVIEAKMVSPTLFKQPLLHKHLETLHSICDTNTKNLIKDFMKSVKEDFTTHVLRTPTQHFKEICGPECLNITGKMSTHDASTFLYHQIEVRGIKTTDTHIYPDEYLANLLKIPADPFHKSWLSIYIEKLFEED